MQVNPMRTTLWFAQCLAIVFLFRTVSLGLGWIVAADPVGSHVKSAFLAMLLSLACHVGVMFYFLGTKRILLEAKENLGFQAPENLMARNKRVISLTVGPTCLAAFTLMVAFILGGAADTHTISFELHGAIAISATVINIFVLIWEMIMTQRNHHVLRSLRAKEWELHQANLK